MNRIDLNRPAAPPADKTITIDGIVVRLVPLPGQERAAIRVRFDILDRGKVVRRMLSCPSAADCHDAVRAARNPAPCAVAEPKSGPFNPTIADTRKRVDARRKRQMAEEPGQADE